MNLSVSNVERAAMFPLFNRPASWGGSEEAMLAIGDIYDTLGLSEFEGRESVNVGDLPSGTIDCMIQDDRIPFLRAVLSQAGQNPNSARIVIGVLRRIRSAVAEKETK
jgi:hypothetical protein